MGRMNGPSIVTPAPSIPPAINSPEEALRWAEALVTDVKLARAALNVPGITPIRELQRLERIYLIKHGSALGAIGALLRLGMLELNAYNTLVGAVRATLI